VGRSGRTHTIPSENPAEPIPNAALNRLRLTTVSSAASSTSPDLPQRPAGPAGARPRALDRLASEPIVSTDAHTDPEHQALLADAVGIALQVVLDALSPAERLAFVLHDLSAVPFDGIAVLLERSPEAARRFAPFVRPALVNGTAGRSPMSNFCYAN